jgi:geranylgeranylglycerol-phosphate geranylgeranyltransferase
MSAVGVLVGGFLIVKAVNFEILLAVIAAFLITGAGNAINDFFDVESDKINRPNRPIPSGRLAKRYAILLTLLLFGIGIILAASINWLCFFIAVLNSLVLVVYSFNLQNKILLGNMAIAYLVASAFVFGGAAVNNILLPLILALLAGLATFSREIVKDLEDLEGDRRSFIKRIATKMKESFTDRFRVSPWGIKLRYETVYAVLIASFSLWMAVVISSIPYIWEILGISYLIILIPTDAVFLLASFILIKRRKYGFVSKLIKIGMALGLLAFLVGILI